MPVLHVEQAGGRGSCFTWNRIGGQPPSVAWMFHVEQRGSWPRVEAAARPRRTHVEHPGAMFHVKPERCSPDAAGAVFHVEHGPCSIVDRQPLAPPMIIAIRSRSSAEPNSTTIRPLR